MRRALSMLTIKFSCDVCGLFRHEMQIPAREDPAVEAVVPWMENTIRMIGEEHSRVSPKCPARRLKDLMIPLPKEGEFLGQQVE